jgi:hypothetical protein
VTLTQDFLRTEVHRRIRAARPGAEPSTAGLDTTADTTTAVVVLRRFDLVPWVRGTVAFAAGLTAHQATAWRGAFTRTVFLAGNPDNLLARFAFDHVDTDAGAAWLAPAPARRFLTLRRLLKLFEAPVALPVHPDRVVDLAGAPTGTERELYVATAGVSVAGTLVNLNHLLAEAVFDGVLRPGDRLRLRHVPRLGGLGPFDALRVGIDPTNPDRLRAYAGIAKEKQYE